MSSDLAMAENENNNNISCDQNCEVTTDTEIQLCHQDCQTIHSSQINGKHLIGIGHDHPSCQIIQAKSCQIIRDKQGCENDGVCQVIQAPIGLGIQVTADNQTCKVTLDTQCCQDIDAGNLYHDAASVETDREKQECMVVIVDSEISSMVNTQQLISNSTRYSFNLYCKVGNTYNDGKHFFFRI